MLIRDNVFLQTVDRARPLLYRWLRVGWLVVASLLDASRYRLEMAVARMCTVADGVTVADLLHFGLDHISAAQTLLKGNARHYDSAGYLAHLGFELLLTAWLLHASNTFPKIHVLEDLWQELLSLPGVQPLPRPDLATLYLFDSYDSLRYPRLNNPVEVGSDDLPRIKLLAKALFKRMPETLREILLGLHWSTKGGRMLMEKPETREPQGGVSSQTVKISPQTQ